MDMEYWSATTGEGRMNNNPATIFLSGPVERGDGEKLRTLIERNPDAEQLIIGKSPGGVLMEGIKMAGIIYDSGIEVQVNGPAASAATIISLGARNTVRFVEGAGARFRGTELLFHCAYIPGKDICDESGTLWAAETLAKYTIRNLDTWFKFLMEKTTPATVERILLRDLIEGEWDCYDAGRKGTECTRWNVVTQDQPDKELGEFEAEPGSCYLVHRRVDETQAMLTRHMGLSQLGGGEFMDINSDIYNSAAGDIVMTFGLVKEGEKDQLIQKIEARLGLNGIEGCVSGAEFVSRHVWQ